MTDSDQRLVHRIRSGSEEAFESLFNKFQPGLFRFLWHMLHSPEAANDLIQEIFLKIWRNRSDWEPTPSVSTYLYRAAKNAALNYQRDAQPGRFQQVTEDQSSGEETSVLAESNEIEAAVSRCIEALPAGCRSVFILSRYEDEKYREIATRLGISLKTVENQMGRALRLLRACLQPFLRN